MGEKGIFFMKYYSCRQIRWRLFFKRVILTQFHGENWKKKFDLFGHIDKNDADAIKQYVNDKKDVSLESKIYNSLLPVCIPSWLISCPLPIGENTDYHFGTQKWEFTYSSPESFFRFIPIFLNVTAINVFSPLLEQ